jgi:hypothetical protein
LAPEGLNWENPPSEARRGWRTSPLWPASKVAAHRPIPSNRILNVSRTGRVEYENIHGLPGMQFRLFSGMSGIAIFSSFAQRCECRAVAPRHFSCKVIPRVHS